jgi:hypothetical protein
MGYLQFAMEFTLATKLLMLVDRPTAMEEDDCLDHADIDRS